MSSTINFETVAGQKFLFSVVPIRSSLPKLPGVYCPVVESWLGGLLGGFAYSSPLYVGRSDGNLDKRAGSGIEGHEHYDDFVRCGATHIAFIASGGFFTPAFIPAQLEQQVYDRHLPPINGRRPDGVFGGIGSALGTKRRECRPNALAEALGHEPPRNALADFLRR